MKRWIGFSFLLLALLLVFGCSGKIKGTAPTNMPPEVFLANIPPDETGFKTLAKVYWYGFDNDGYITRYQYLVIPDTGKLIPKSGGYIDSLFVKKIESVSPQDWNDSYFSRLLGIKIDTVCSGLGRPCHPDSIIKIDTILTPVHVIDSTGTWDNAMLFSYLNPDSVLDQYFFVRAVDNEGAVSRIWKPDSEKGSTFRRFSRTNHPPVTKINYSDSMVEYCLPETTVDWKGIRITWTAQDPDYSSRSQPTFSYTWKLFGPFDSPDKDDTSKVYYSSWDSINGVPWVDSTSRVFINLENAKGLGYGWYTLKVTARDDAFTPDPNPPEVAFKSIKPPFLFSNEKSVLFVETLSMYEGWFITPNFSALRTYYTELLDSLKLARKIDRYRFYEYWEPYPPPEDVFSQHKLVIYISEAKNSKNSGIPGNEADTGYFQMERYLKVGGRVWMIGHNDFGLGALLSRPTFWPVSLRNFGAAKITQTTVRVANNFFGVTGVFLPNLNSDTLSGGRNEEIIGAIPVDSVHTGLSHLEVDPSKLTTRYYDFSEPGMPVPPPPWDSLKGIPRAGYVSIFIADNVQQLYTAVSYKGSISKIQGRPCAVRTYSPNPLVLYENGNPYTLQWRTAEFCFPGLPLKQNQMLNTMKTMIDWFMLDKYPSQ